MRYTLDQRSRLDDLLTSQPPGEFDENTLADEYAEYLHEQALAGELHGAIDELARSAVRSAVSSRSWDVTSDAIGLFDADALLSQGDGVQIRMGDARAFHVGRHLQILEENHARQVRAFAIKSDYLSSRLPVLLDRDCTLGDLEEAA